MTGPRQQVHAHQLDARAGLHGDDGVLGAHGPAVDAEGLGDGGAGDVGVQYGGAEALALHGDGQLACDHGLAYAALAGDHAVDLAHPAALVQGLLFEYVCLLALSAAFTAAAAIMGTFAHRDISFAVFSNFIFPIHILCWL